MSTSRLHLRTQRQRQSQEQAVEEAGLRPFVVSASETIGADLARAIVDAGIASHPVLIDNCRLSPLLGDGLSGGGSPVIVSVIPSYTRKQLCCHP